MQAGARRYTPSSMMTALPHRPEVVQAAEVVRVAEPDLAEGDPVQVAAVRKAEADREEDEVLVGAEDRIAPRVTAPKTAGIAAARWPHGRSSPSAPKSSGGRSLAPTIGGLPTQWHHVAAAPSGFEHA